MGSVKKTQLPMLFEGERAMCFCCDQALPIQLVGIDRDLSEVKWIAPRELVEALYLDLTIPEVVEHKTGFSVHCYRCAVPIYHGKHYWLNQNPEDTEGRFIIGPLHDKCLQAQVLESEDSTGRIMPVIAYAINYTKKISLALHGEPTRTRTANDDVEVTLESVASAFPIF